MAVDLTMVPWDRLAKLAPPGTPVEELQVAADRWAITADVYGAAADLWEEKLLSIDLSPDPPTPFDPANPLAGKISGITQDGIRIEYAVSNQAGDTQNSRRSQVIQIRAIVRSLRAKSKPHSPLVHSRDYNPWKNTAMDDVETIIVVDDI